MKSEASPVSCAYANRIRRAFREKVKRTAGRGRCAVEGWPELHIGTVIKRTVNKRLKEVLRQMAYGNLEAALKLLERSRGATMLNTAFIERFNGSATSTYLLTLSEATNKEVCW